jgi:hypothetical protein
MADYLRKTVQTYSSDWTCSQVSDVRTGNSAAAIARRRLCGLVFSLTTREQAIMEDTFYMRFVLWLEY